MNVQLLRSQTPACEHVLHFNNAGASLMPDAVYLAVTKHLELERQLGGYEAAELAADAISSFYPAFAELLNAEPGEIAFVENATRAWDMAFYALALQPGDRVLTHGSEYASNFLAMLHRASRQGIEIDVAPSDSSGQIDLELLPRQIRPRTRLIAITHVPTQGGLVNPAVEVGRIARAHGLLYLLDACQSVGQMRVDVKEIGCHMLSGTGRKYLRGPRGTGFLYVESSLVEQLDPPFIDLHSATWTSPKTYSLAPDATRFENWESYVAGRIGLAAAARYASAIGMARIQERVVGLGKQLREQLAGIDGVTVHDLGKEMCGIVTFTKSGVSCTEMARLLGARAINVSVSLDVYSQLDLGARGLPQVVRASAHYYNTEEEVAFFARAVQEANSP